MSEKKVWTTSEDGEIEYVSVMKEHLPGCYELMRTSFFLHENICKAVGIPGNTEAMEELEELTTRAINDGVSVIAVEKSTQKVIGAAFNKIQLKNNPGEGTYFEDYARNCKNASSKALVQFMIDADGTINLFDLLKVDCTLEIMFLMTSPDHRRRGIGSKVCECSIQLARELLKGNNVKKSLTDKMLPLEPVPKAVSAIFTAFRSQIIGKRLSFAVAKEISYDMFSYQGKKYSNLIEKESPNCTVEYFLL